METKLQKLETTSEKTEFAEPIHSESSHQEAETTSEKTNLQIRALQTIPAEKLKHKYLDKNIIILRWRRNCKN